MPDSFDTSSYSTVNQLNAEKADRVAEDAVLSAELGDLQAGFDTAVLAAQDGADNLTIELQSYSKKDHTHSDYASSSHSHPAYAASSHTHSGMAVMKKGTSTNPSLSQGEMYLNISQKILYIGV